MGNGGMKNLTLLDASPIPALRSPMLFLLCYCLSFCSPISAFPIQSVSPHYSITAQFKLFSRIEKNKKYQEDKHDTSRPNLIRTSAVELGYTN